MTVGSFFAHETVICSKYYIIVMVGAPQSINQAGDFIPPFRNNCTYEYHEFKDTIEFFQHLLRMFGHKESAFSHCVVVPVGSKGATP